MNTKNIKNYAPKARKAFIEAMSKQAAKYGITKKKIEPAEQKGDLVLIGDRPFPASVIKPRERLVKRIEQQGFDQVMEHVAYSWFNRLCAIRYMELKGFLDHGRRVLSSVEGSAADGSAGVPQILEECLDVELPGLEQTKVRELKLDGTKDEELYRELLLAQCHALHQAMPFLFEAVADESELLLPENLTKTDSLIRDLVASIPDEDWDHIEIIGWLYQFYISEKKDQVMGKVVKSEDIPAATQLFTPNWIVQYLVQNSVGRQWLQTYPDSPLKEKMPYYIEPAEQTPEVHVQLAEITPSEIAPETIKVLDPAAGSGHILVEAYKVLKAIYEERGYRTRDIPQLILENNLFGLDIDDRAGQLAGFALMMLAREDDRRIFSRNIRLNVLSLQESANVNLSSLWKSLNLAGEWQSGTSQGLFEEEQQDLSAFAADNRYQLLQRTLERFKQAKTFGSLIDIPHDDYEDLKELFTTLCELEGAGDSMQKAAATQLLPYVHQAVLLAQKYDAVVANPPYMGSKGMNADLKEFAKIEYPNSKSDLFAVFMERALSLVRLNGFNAQVNMQSWMYLSSFELLREKLLEHSIIQNLIHIGFNTFPAMNSKIAQGCAFCIQNTKIYSFKSRFVNLNSYPPSYNKKNALDEVLDCSSFIDREQIYFESIPGKPLAYSLEEALLNLFKPGLLLKTIGDTRQGMATSDNNRFLRLWWECDFDLIGIDADNDEKFQLSRAKWAPYNKGGDYRRWYGNQEWVLNWAKGGQEVLEYAKSLYGSPTRTIKSISRYFEPCLSWSKVTWDFGMRLYPKGFIFDVAGCCIFTERDEHSEFLLAYTNTSMAKTIMQAFSPTLNYEAGSVSLLPIPENTSRFNAESSRKCLAIVKEDWDTFERSLEYRQNVLVKYSLLEKLSKTSVSFSRYQEYSNDQVTRLRNLELENERSVFSVFGISLEPKVLSDKRITIDSNPVYRYGDDIDASALKERYQSDTLYELVSYAVGCMMGRYSLDREGLVYAHSDNKGFFDLVEEGAFKTFPADDDGIIPLTDQEWFPDDATNRFREFVKVVWADEHLHENLDFVAESLCLHAIKPKKSESSMDTIRRYLSTQFYKDHLKTYKKRPIYWLFSSGKQKAFECLVYLHRYNEGTLARMRTEYVIPLTAKMAAYAQKLENDKEASGSAAEVKRLEKEIAQLHKQQAELSEFDEKLRHYADQRIRLDLDDGVKVNYGKFGDLLAEVKAVTGKKPEELA